MKHRTGANAAEAIKAAAAAKQERVEKAARECWAALLEAVQLTGQQPSEVALAEVAGYAHCQLLDLLEPYVTAYVLDTPSTPAVREVLLEADRLAKQQGSKFMYVAHLEAALRRKG